MKAFLIALALTIAALVGVNATKAEGKVPFGQGCSAEFIEALSYANLKPLNGFKVGVNTTVSCISQDVVDNNSRPRLEPGETWAYTYPGNVPAIIIWSNAKPFSWLVFKHETCHNEEDPNNPGFFKRHDEHGVWDHTGRADVC